MFRESYFFTTSIIEKLFHRYEDTDTKQEYEYTYKRKKYKTRVVIIILWIFRGALFRNIPLISRDYRRYYYIVRGTPCPEIRSIQCDQSRRCSKLRETVRRRCTRAEEKRVKRIKEKKTNSDKINRFAGGKN